MLNALKRKIIKVSVNIKSLRPIALLNSRNTPFVPLFWNVSCHSLCYSYLCGWVPLTAHELSVVMAMMISFIFSAPLTPIPGGNESSQNEWVNGNNRWYYFHITIPELILRNSYWHITDFGSGVLCMWGSRRVMHTPEWVKVSQWLQSHQQTIYFI